MPRSGTTLIEALVAIALVATVLPVALGAVSDGSRAIEQARRSSLAERVAQSRLAQLVADGSWATSATSGTCSEDVDGEDAAGLRWNLAVETWRDPVVRRVAVTVAWGTGVRGGSVTAETLATPPVTASE